ncbi:MAG: hypothetical protein ABR538_07140 [Candidatus Binatia bacterium]
MNVRENLLSVGFAFFVVLKVAEVAVGMEWWPVSNVSMFSGRRPAEVIPFRSRLEAWQDGKRRVFGRDDFLLSDGEMKAWLHPDAAVADRCTHLVASFNRRTALPSQRMRHAVVVAEPVPRPDVASGAVLRLVRCPEPGPLAGGDPH